jgi:hypothetical protein
LSSKNALNGFSYPRFSDHKGGDQNCSLGTDSNQHVSGIGACTPTLNDLRFRHFLTGRKHSQMMINPHAKLAEVLHAAQEYLDLAVNARDRSEREFYGRILELYIRIAREFEAVLDG